MVRARGQITLPREIREALPAEDGHDVAFLLEEEQVRMRGLKSIPAEQSWFWTDAWRASERDASEQVAAGDGTVFDNGGAVLDSLREVPTYQRLPRLHQDWRSLRPAGQKRFRGAVARFVENLEEARHLGAGLRVKAVQETANIVGMSKCLNHSSPAQ